MVISFSWVDEKKVVMDNQGSDMRKKSPACISKVQISHLPTICMNNFSLNHNYKVHKCGTITYKAILISSHAYVRCVNTILCPYMNAHIIHETLFLSLAYTHLSPTCKISSLLVNMARGELLWSFTAEKK